MIQFLHVTKTFRNNWKALDNISFRVKKGELVFLTGHSGAGKTTVLRHIYLDERPDLEHGGQVVLGFGSQLHYDSKRTPESKVQSLRRRMGIVFQDFKLLYDRDVFENVAFALRVAGGMSNREIKERVYEILATTGLSHRRSAMPHTLAGGEKQRVAIARAVVNEPYILLADEPTGNLDPAGALKVFEILKEINARGTSVIMATHNPALYENKSYRVLKLEQGRLVNRQTF